MHRISAPSPKPCSSAGFFPPFPSCGASCYISLLFRAVAAASAWLLQPWRLAGSSVVLLALIVRRALSTSCSQHTGGGWDGTKAGFVLQHLLVLAGKSFGSLKPLRPSLILRLSVFYLLVKNVFRTMIYSLEGRNLCFLLSYGCEW